MVTVLDENNLALCAIVTVGMQLFFFLVAAAFRFDKVTDLAGGSNFVVLALLSFFLAGTYHPRQIAVTVMVSVWGTRLAEYCLERIIRIGKDDRFDGIRENLLKFAAFWVFQAIWVFSVSLAMLLVNSPTWVQRQAVPEFGTVADIVGVIMWVIGFSTEALADRQKFSFRMQPQNSGRFCSVGLWSWSRHPNYFGEILLWFGIFTVQSSTIIQSWMWIGLISPLMTMALLLFLSGMPKLEQSSDERYGGLPDYQDYKNSVSPLIPMPPALFSRLPYILKTLIFEWPLYDSRQIVRRVQGEI